MKIRFVLLLSLLLIAVTAAPAMAAGKSAKVDPQTKQTAAVVAGDTAWIAIDWLARDGDAENFQVTVIKIDDGVEFSYPPNTGTYTSLWADDLLSENELDFTAIKLSVPYDARRHLNMQVLATYTTDGTPQEKRVEILVPIVTHTGADLEQVTSDLGSISQASSTWVDVQYAGFAPLLEDFAVTVTDPGGLTVVYPAEGTSTSLVHDATLEDHETDLVRFRIDTSDLDEGIHTLQIEAAYSKGGVAGSLIGTVTVTVAPPST